ncbi:S8 family serine peptidase [Streptomyces sp. NPDC090106]|uniref:S8 family serine peptidase n=1 Tax=Streptomyces sp. NPDC090106 TaxID=3365946 RepID=UPI0038284FB2
MASFRIRRALPVLFTLVSFGVVPGAGVAVADASPGAVRLPVVPGRLADGAACTAGSSEVVTAAPWEQRSLQLTRVRSAGTGAGVTVAVVDTGVSAAAPALAGRVTVSGGAGADCVGHGTFVAGLVAAAPVAGVSFAGVAPGARILAVRGTDGRGAATAATVARGIRAAVDGGAGVVVVSPALTEDSAALRGAVGYAARHDTLIVAAAVPDGFGGSTGTAPPARDYWPAAFDGVLSVLDVDVDGVRPAGAFAPLRADLAAPGQGVLGIGPRGRGHLIGSGASLAAGYAAGAAALIRAARPELTAAQTADRLIATAYPADVPRLDPYAALTTVRAASPAPVPAAEAPAPVRPAHDGGAVRATHRALLLAGAGAGVLLLVVWAAVVVPRGRARGWRPGGPVAAAADPGGPGAGEGRTTGH